MSSQICKEFRCFLEKFTQLEIFLHYHRSWRLQQIFSLLAFTDVYERKEVIGFEPTAPFLKESEYNVI